MMEPNEMLEEIDRVIKNSMRKKREGMPLEDDKDSNVTANDGWIPVEVRQPEEKVNPVSQDFYEYQVTAKFGNVKDVRHYKYGNGHWWHGPGIVDKYVTAWRESPEPYRPEKEQERTENIMGGRLENLKKEERT